MLIWLLDRGYFAAGLIFVTLNRIWPPLGLGELVLWDGDVVDGVLESEEVASEDGVKNPGEKGDESHISQKSVGM